MSVRFAAVAVTTVAIAAVVLVVVLQRRLVYFPDLAPSVTAGLPGRPVTLETADGLRLAAWFVPPSGSDSGVRVLVCNGNAGNFGDRTPLALALSRRGIGVLLFDYRGYGGNPGSPSESGLAADADAAQRWLVQHGGGRRLVYFGESIGAAVATGLAERHAPDVLVLRSPFSSLAAAARAALRVPVDWLLWDEFPVAATVRELDVPLLVIAAAEDEVIPLAQSREVHAYARGPKDLHVVQGARHNDRAVVAGPAMVDAIVAFVGRHS